MAFTQIFEMIGFPPQSNFDLARLTEEGISTDSLSALKDRGLDPSQRLQKSSSRRERSSIARLTVKSRYRRRKQIGS